MAKHSLPVLADVRALELESPEAPLEHVSFIIWFNLDRRGNNRKTIKKIGSIFTGMGWWFYTKRPSGFSAASTAEEVTEGIGGTGLTAIITGYL